MNKPLLGRGEVSKLVETVCGEDMHAKRVLSVTNAVMGVVHAAALSIHAIGLGLAQSVGLNPKHAIKQVDRLLSNGALDVWALFAHWVPHVVGAQREIVVALDWTEFDDDDQSTIALYLVTKHGRATPLLWKTVKKSSLLDRRNQYEDQVLLRLKEVLPEGTRVTVLADRGFGDQKLYEFLGELDFDFVIRFRAVVRVEDTDGEACSAGEWVPLNGRIKHLKNARVTASRFEVGGVVCVKARGMKDAWCLATSRTDLTGTEVVKLYGKRFTIEETFRDQKDNRYGLGLSATHIGDASRRDRLLLICAMAMSLLTLLGAAGESLGMDRMLKANTVKKRTHSLFRQGCYYYGAIPQMKPAQLEPLIQRFGQYVLGVEVYVHALGLK